MELALKNNLFTGLAWISLKPQLKEDNLEKLMTHIEVEGLLESSWQACSHSSAKTKFDIYHRLESCKDIYNMCH